MYPAGFKGRAQRLTDIDIARTALLIGTGEDEIRAVIEVETSGGGRIMAFDVLGCGEGEEVMVVTGSTAASWLGGGKIPIDALIIGSLDQPADAKSARK